MIITKIKKNKLFVLVILIYIGMLIFAPDKALKSLNNSVYYLLEMLQVLPIIFLITVLIDAWIPKETIIKRLGNKSGIAGNVFSLLLGSLSAGPIYAAFPLSKMLIKKGASITNIVIILSSWAVIKVPMLLNEAKFLGPDFMVVRWLLTVSAILIMGYLINLIVKKKDIPENEAIEDSKVEIKISKEYCVSCGICAKHYPKYYKMNGDKVILLSKGIAAGDKDIVQSSIEKCPANAISLS